MENQELDAFFIEEILPPIRRAYQDGLAGVTDGYPWDLSSDTAEHLNANDLNNPRVMKFLNRWYEHVNFEYRRGREDARKAVLS